MKISTVELLIYAGAAAAAYMLLRRRSANDARLIQVAIPRGAVWDETQGAYVRRV